MAQVLSQLSVQGSATTSSLVSCLTTVLANQVFGLLLAGQQAENSSSWVRRVSWYSWCLRTGRLAWRWIVRLRKILHTLLSQPGSYAKDNVLLAHDGLNAATKMVGLDVSKSSSSNLGVLPSRWRTASAARWPFWVSRWKWDSCRGRQERQAQFTKVMREHDFQLPDPVRGGMVS